MATVLSSELGEVAFRVIESQGPNAWLVLIVAGDCLRVANALRDELLGLGDETVRVVSVARPEELAAASRENTHGILIVAGAHVRERGRHAAASRAVS